MAYQILHLTNARTEVRCAPGSIAHIAFNGVTDSWRVEEDLDRREFRTFGDALNLARLLGGDPDIR